MCFAARFRTRPAADLAFGWNLLGAVLGGLTESIRARRGTNAKILQDTGNLAGSIQPRSGSRVAEAFTRVPYAKFHVSDAPRNVIPKRDFLAIKFKDVTSQAAQILLREVLK